MSNTLIGYEPSLLLSNGNGVRPPLKWAGGKRWLVPYMQEVWHKHTHRRLVEPFCGGLAITLGLLPNDALLNDINAHAIHFYRWLKKGLKHEIEMLNQEDAYYTARSRFNELIMTGKANSKEAAALFYYLNRTGYNGLCRFNRQGEFNVPFGRYSTINYQGDFSSYKKVFQKWEFAIGDFEKVALAPDDFVYADPPYDVEFRQYAKEGFSWDDQVRLAEWLSRHEGPVVLSNQATERVVSLYRELGFELRFLQARRMISCTGDRSYVEEVLAMKGV